LCFNSFSIGDIPFWNPNYILTHLYNAIFNSDLDNDLGDQLHCALDRSACLAYKVEVHESLDVEQLAMLVEPEELQIGGHHQEAEDHHSRH
jgi:hypothetical protein